MGNAETYKYLPVLGLLNVIGLATITSGETGVTCPSPAIPSNAQVTISGDSLLVPGAVATFKCDEGYQIFGSQTLVCAQDGTWQGQLPFCAVDVAYRKPANQSSTARGGDAGNAVDGNVATLHDGKYCTETRRESSAWWRVDLLRSYEVRVVRLVSRKCCGQHTIQSVEIRVGNSSLVQKNRLCSWDPEALDDGATKDYTCAAPMMGRFVFVQLPGMESSLSICEVQVFTTQEFSRERCADQALPDRVGAFSQTCYEVHTGQGANFKKARAQCRSRGGDLVHSIKNVTQNFLAGELDRLKTQLSTQLIWIGATKEPGQSVKTWRWVNNDMVTHPMWGEDQPNNYNGEQNCIVLDGGRGWMWNDVGCNLDYLLWVCQYVPVTCGSPNRELNTTMTSSNFSVGMSIGYSCPLDSMLIGSENRTCQPTGFWSGDAPKCKYVDCGELPSIVDGHVILLDNRTTYGALAEYRCRENYTILGPPIRTCGANNQWDGRESECVFSVCPKPLHPPNASLTVSGLRAGDNASYTCDKGHRPDGERVLTCKLGGKWSGEPPTCTYVNCGIPSGIPNGDFMLQDNSTTYKSTVTYFCAANHMLRGVMERSCEGKGHWEGEDPTCEIISCGEPDVHEGSFVVGYEFTVGAVVEYSCDPGHLMGKGDPNRMCDPSGKWTGKAPTCSYVECNRVQPIPYAVLDYVNATTFLGSVVRYECTATYRLIGDDVRVCQPDRRWNGSTPTCQEIRCPEPARPLNSILSVSGNDRSGTGDTFKIGSSVQYRCEQGFQLLGEQSQTCDSSGSWSNLPPECFYVDCGSLDSVIHGFVNVSAGTTHMGSEATYSCHEGYELSGEDHRTCQENGSWSGTSPLCKEVTCGLPDKPPNVSLDAPSHTAGSVATYGCVRGKRLVGNATRMCLQTGRWSGSAPECQWVDCGPPPIIVNGRPFLSNQPTTYNSSIEYFCFEKYKLVGPSKRWCSESGAWNDSAPTCELDTSKNDIKGSSAVSSGPSEEEIVSARAIGIGIGVGAGGLLLILIAIALLYMRIRAPKPMTASEHAETPNDKEAATVVSYAARRSVDTTELSGGGGGRINGGFNG